MQTDITAVNLVSLVDRLLIMTSVVVDVEQRLVLLSGLMTDCKAPHLPI